MMDSIANAKNRKKLLVSFYFKGDRIQLIQLFHIFFILVLSLTILGANRTTISKFSYSLLRNTSHIHSYHISFLQSISSSSTRPCSEVNGVRSNRVLGSNSAFPQNVHIAASARYKEIMKILSRDYRTLYTCMYELIIS